MYMKGTETNNPKVAMTKLDPTFVIANISLGKLVRENYSRICVSLERVRGGEYENE